MTFPWQKKRGAKTDERGNGAAPADPALVAALAAAVRQWHNRLAPDGTPRASAGSEGALIAAIAAAVRERLK